jgi:hypothetical protein
MIEQTNTSMGQKAIVVLNNTGVTLLQRQRFGDAEVTFKDAVDLMSCVSDNRRRPMMTEKLPIFLNRAASRIARSTIVSEVEVSPQASDFFLRVLEKEENNVNELLSAIPGWCRGYVYKLELDEESLNAVVDTGKMLHNFSVAIRMRVQQQGGNSSLPNSIERMKLAHRMGQCAHSILFEHVSTSDANQEDTKLSIYEQQCYADMLQVSVIVVLDLILFSSAEHPTSETTQMTQNYFKQLIELRSKLDDVQETVSYHPLLEAKRMAARMA